MTPGITTYSFTCDIDAPEEHRARMPGQLDAQMAMVAGWKGLSCVPTGREEWAALGWSGQDWVTQAECARLGERWRPGMAQLTRWYEVTV